MHWFCNSHERSSTNSIYTQVVKLIERLLKGQAKLVKTVNIDDRLHLGFLGTVVLPSHMDADPAALENINMVRFHAHCFSLPVFLIGTLSASILISFQLSAALKFCNAQSHIRATYVPMQIVVSDASTFAVAR